MHNGIIPEVLTKTENELIAACTSTDHKYLYLASTDNVIQKWDLADRKMLQEFSGIIDGNVKEIACSPSYFIVATEDGNLKSFKVDDDSEVHDYGKVQENIVGLVCSKKSDGFAITIDNECNTMKIDLEGDKGVNDLHDSIDGKCKRLLLCPQDEVLFVSNDKGNISVHYLASDLTMINIPNKKKDKVSSMVCDGKNLYIGYERGRIKHYDVKNQVFEDDFKDGNKCAIKSMCISMDKKYLFTSDSLGYFNTYNLKKKMVLSSNNSFDMKKAYNVNHTNKLLYSLDGMIRI